MENKETKNSMKEIKNRIILKNLSKKQKETLTKMEIVGGVIGLGAGLLTLYSMKTPETIPIHSIETTTVNDTNDFEEIEPENSIEILTLKPVTEINDQNISFGEAFKVAREICGKGGWFIWKDNVYNTYYKEEWQDLSPDERNDYMASIEIQNFQKDENPKIQETLASEQNENLYASSDDSKDANESVSNDQRTEISTDLNSLNTQTINNIEDSNQSNELVQGEIITLNDESEIADNDYFELPDDIIITTISDEESSLIDKLTFDSSEITSFPWEVSTDKTSTQSLITDQESIPTDLDEATNDDKSVDALNEKEEYPWGEPINNQEESPVITQVHEEIQKDENTKIITNPDEIKEYPWGESLENIENNPNQTSSETVIGEINEESGQSHPNTFSVIEEYPWGEKNENFDPTGINQVLDGEENIGVILPEENETEVLGQLPSSFNDVTEFPWGETVPHSPVDPYNTPDNDIMENHSDPTVQ